MVESTKIKKGTFTGSYTAPKKRMWTKWALIGLAVIIVLGLVGWFIWQNEMDKRLDTETYDTAIESSEGISPFYYSEIERNARFQKCSDITLDAYIEKQRSIRAPADKYHCATILTSANYPEFAAELYEEIITNDNLPSEISEQEFYEQAHATAVQAQDNDLKEKSLAGIKKALDANDAMPDFLKEEILRSYES